MRADFRWMLFLRILAMAGAVFLFLLGINYNKIAWGFEFKPEYAWVGVGFAILCTVLEMIWNHEASRANLSIMFFGAAAYIFGFIANGIGIYSTIQNPENMGVIGWLFLISVTLLVEAVPEPLAVFAITGMWSGGDFIKQIITIATGKARTPPVPMAQYNITSQMSQQKKPSPPPQSQQQQPRQTGGGSAGAAERFQESLERRAKELGINIDK